MSGLDYDLLDDEPERPDEDPEWFLELAEGTLTQREERDLMRRMRRDPELEARYESYCLRVQQLRELGDSVSEDDGGDDLRDRILGAWQQESNPQPTPRVAETARTPRILAMFATTGVAAAALIAFLWIGGGEPPPKVEREPLAFNKIDSLEAEKGEPTEFRRLRVQEEGPEADPPNPPRKLIPGLAAGEDAESLADKAGEKPEVGRRQLRKSEVAEQRADRKKADLDAAVTPTVKETAKQKKGGVTRERVARHVPKDAPPRAGGRTAAGKPARAEREAAREKKDALKSITKAMKARTRSDDARVGRLRRAKTPGPAGPASPGAKKPTTPTPGGPTTPAETGSSLAMSATVDLVLVDPARNVDFSRVASLATVEQFTLQQRHVRAWNNLTVGLTKDQSGFGQGFFGNVRAPDPTKYQLLRVRGEAQKVSVALSRLYGAAGGKRENRSIGRKTLVRLAGLEKRDNLRARARAQRLEQLMRRGTRGKKKADPDPAKAPTKKDAQDLATERKRTSRDEKSAKKSKTTTRGRGAPRDSKQWSEQSAKKDEVEIWLLWKR